MQLTMEQRIAAFRDYHLKNSKPIQLGTAPSVDERACRPNPAQLPTGATVLVEIAPPSSHPHLLLDGSALKSPEPVPIYTYALHGQETESDASNTTVVFFIHGGGNLMGHPTHPPSVNLYFQILRAIVSRSGDAGKKCVLIAPSYRLATIPENTFPAALQDLVAAYDHVLAKRYKPSNIVIAGDSAGGGHALALTHLVLQSKGSTPRGVISIAPTAIQVYDSLSELARENANTDIIRLPIAEMMSSVYVGASGVSRADPLVSPAYLPFTPSWPKTLVLVGSGDILIDGSREVEKQLLAVNAPVELVEYKDHPHGWWVVPDIFPECNQDMLRRIAEFVVE